MCGANKAPPSAPLQGVRFRPGVDFGASCARTGLWREQRHGALAPERAQADDRRSLRESSGSQGFIYRCSDSLGFGQCSAILPCFD